MNLEKLSIVGFITLVFYLIYMDQNREVTVHICESKGVSTYVSVIKPPEELQFGECHVEPMLNSRYYHLRQVMKRGIK
jgi:hypothetical protein